MRQMLRKRFWFEAILAVMSGMLLCVTLIWPDWLEIAFALELDSGNGMVERGIVIGLLFATLVLSFFARYEWKHAQHIPV